MLNVFLRRRLRAVLPDVDARMSGGRSQRFQVVCGRVAALKSKLEQISWHCFSPAVVLRFIEPPLRTATRPQEVTRDYEAHEGTRRGNTRSKFGHLASWGSPARATEK